ncbi:hypothetical protein Y032_0017g3192 [Ancylostoma ceylanicum]|uniref:Uncharacterized protein n=1 Tax=Ancylostoma ceylanicum TaxID=53326 RepID=A0A016V594_9BILA|nr:hypothetical protein Y032_0017g3192 [Ancylostoma ceylanicum]
MKTSAAAAKQSLAGAKSIASPGKSNKAKKPDEAGAKSNRNAKEKTDSTMKNSDVAKVMATQYESEKKPKGTEKKETPSHHSIEKKSKEEKGKAPAKPGETMEEGSVLKQVDASKPPEGPAPPSPDPASFNDVFACISVITKTSRQKKPRQTLLRYKRIS